MNLVIDTNIVFSAILNPNSNIGDLLLNFQNKVSFYAPEFLLVEIEKWFVLKKSELICASQ